jgi:hypothetical protein
LGVEELILIHHSRKKGGASNSGLGLGNASIGDSGTVRGLHRLCAPDRLIKGDRCRGRWCGGLSLSYIAAAAEYGYDDAEISKGILFINQRIKPTAGGIWWLM